MNEPSFEQNFFQAIICLLILLGAIVLCIYVITKFIKEIEESKYIITKQIEGDEENDAYKSDAET